MSEPYPHTDHGRHEALPPPLAAGRRPRRRWRKPVLLAGLGLVAVGLAAAALLASGALSRVFAHQMITVHGTEHLVVNSKGGSTQSAFPDITAGSRVTVVDSSGTVIGTGTLAPSDPDSWGAGDAVYAFTVTVPAGERRYGIQIGRSRGTSWLTQGEMRAGPALSVSG